jgi:hypothetical protein
LYFFGRKTVLLVERYDTESELDLSFFLNGVSELSLHDVKTAEAKTAAFINIIGKDKQTTRKVIFE